MGTHDVLDVMVWVSVAESPAITQSLRVVINNQQTNLILYRRDALRQLAMATLLNVSVIYLNDSVSFLQSRTVCR